MKDISVLKQQELAKYVIRRTEECEMIYEYMQMLLRNGLEQEPESTNSTYLSKQLRSCCWLVCNKCEEMAQQTNCLKFAYHRRYGGKDIIKPSSQKIFMGWGGHDCERTSTKPSTLSINPFLNYALHSMHCVYPEAQDREILGGWLGIVL